MNNANVQPLPEFHKSIISVFLLSCSTIALQLSLIRILSVTRLHHFTFFVISTALLGYGTSGIFLLFVGKKWLAHYRLSSFWTSACTVLLGLPALIFALNLPMDSQSLFQTPEQIIYFIVCNVLIVIPFFLPATSIGLSLMNFDRRSSTIYGASMIGTAIGGIIAVACMFQFAEERLLQIACVPALFASWIWLENKKKFNWLAAVATTCVLIFLTWQPSGLFIEPSKSIGQLQRLASQGDAKLILTRHSPRGRIDVYESKFLHFTLFAGIHATQAPPPQFALLRDGYSSGTVYKVQSEAECSILDQTPASVAYRLYNHPRVLLLSETGGTNVWLARRFSASSITVVQSDPEILNILKGPLAAPSGFVFSGKNTHVVRAEPRLFLEKPGTEKYDVIQIVSAEEMAAESRGAGGLQEDYLLTVEALRAAWKKLSPDGVISISRGIQAPPRDSLKLVMMLRTHLQNEGISDFSNHIVLLQNYLADNILLFRSPDSQQLRKLPEIAKTLAMQIQYPSEISSADADVNEEEDQFPNLKEALSDVLSDRYREFVKTWIYDIRPSTDDRPYFRDFFRVQAIPWMKEVYSDQWYQNVELGFAILILIGIQALVMSFLFLIVPVLIHLRRQIFDYSKSHSGFTITTTLLYFFSIGIGFMGFEIVAISRSVLFLGDPLYAATTAISCLLLGAGIGSLFAGRQIERAAQSIRTASLLIIFYGAILIVSSFYSSTAIFSASTALRFTITAIVLLPLSFLLGFFFPLGLHLAQHSSKMLAPWAWATNGFASVAAPPLLTMLAMISGQRSVIAVSMICYAICGILANSHVAKK